MDGGDMSKVYDVYDLDDLQASIIITYKDEVQEVKIHNPYYVRHAIMGAMVGDILNIKGLGRLKIIQVKAISDEVNYLNLMEVVLYTRWVSDWWNTTTTALVLSTLKSVDNYKEWVTDKYGES